MTHGVSNENLLLILGVMSFSGSLMLLTLRTPTSEAAIVPYTLISSAGIPITTSVNLSAQPAINNDAVMESSTAIFLHTIRLCVARKMLWLHPIFLHIGISNAIFYGLFPLEMEASQVGYVLAVFGVADVIGSITWGKGYDRFGWKLLVFMGFIVGPVVYAFSLFGQFGYWTFYIASFGFGMLDSLQSTLCFCTLSSVFVDENERMCSFSVSEFSTALIAGVAYFFFPYVGYFYTVVVAAVMFIFACICLCGLHIFEMNSNFFSKVNIGRGFFSVEKNE